MDDVSINKDVIICVIVVVYIFVSIVCTMTKIVVVVIMAGLRCVLPPVSVGLVVRLFRKVCFRSEVRRD